MLLILELLFLGFGIYAIFSGKMPGFLFGGGKYTAEGNKVRLLGLLLLVPMPLSFCIGLTMALAVGEDSVILGAIIEILIVVSVAVVASIIYKRIRQPVLPEEEVPKQEIEM